MRHLPASHDALASIHMVLVSPKEPGNVGAAARAVMNQGLGSLKVVEPRAGLDLRGPEARRLARDAARLIDELETCSRLADALPPSTYLVATSVRAGRPVPVSTPREAAPRLVGIARERPLAVLFGAEDTGLPNRLVRQSHEGLRIPSSAAYPSLNLAQAVLLVAYELHLAAGAAARTGPREPPPELSELDGLEQDAREVLALIDYLKPHNEDRVRADLSRLLVRAAPDAREVRMLRGICRQVRWLASRRGP